MRQLYDELGHGYAITRRTDPRIALILWEWLGDARTVLNVGAGTGSYEPGDREVVAVEPSATMRAQRAPDAAPCVSEVAEALPFGDRSFDVTMSAFSHWHWADQERGFAELQRVARQRVLVVALDISIAEGFWLSQDYLPGAHELWDPFDDTVRHAQPDAIVPIPIPGNCVDGFFHAFWRRPQVYLDPTVRKTMAVFKRMNRVTAADGLQRLRSDLKSGRWCERHGVLIRMDSLDLGYRLLVHECG